MSFIKSWIDFYKQSPIILWKGYEGIDDFDIAFLQSQVLSWNFNNKPTVTPFYGRKSTFEYLASLSSTK